MKPFPTPLSFPPLARLSALVAVSLPLLVACGGGGGGGSDTPPAAPVATVSSAVVGTAKFGQPVLLTLTGANLDLPITVTSAGCTAPVRSTTAPNISTATTAYYTCTVSAIGSQQFAITRSADSASLATAAYTVAAPAVTTATVSAPRFGQAIVLTVNGTNLDEAMTVSSAGCTGITRSTTAPNISTATTAFYTCTVSAVGAQQFAITRNFDNASIGTAAYTVAVPVVSNAVVSAPRYGQQALLTVTGTNLDEPMTVTSAGCTNITRSTTAPNISSATTAYYGCRVSGVGAQQFAIARNADNASIGTAAYTVPVPQVTMTVSNGAAVSGSFVITLAPQQAPVTVNNFLNYVNSGFYNNSIFHRLVSNFVLQAGGYDAGVTTGARPPLKPVNPAIVLEDNVGLSNTTLTVAMARTGQPDTATSQFFINLVDNLFLNRTSDTARGYAVFGTITSGAGTVTSMTTAPCVGAPLIASECLPIPNLVISSAVQTQ